MIKAEHLSKKYGNIVALDDVSFEVEKGETFGLLGPNGAGKTTTIKVLCGLIKPDNGNVSLNGKSDPTLVDVRQSLGVVPQALAIYDQDGYPDHIFGLYGRAISIESMPCRLWYRQFMLRNRGQTNLFWKEIRLLPKRGRTGASLCVSSRRRYALMVSGRRQAMNNSRSRG